MKKIATATVGFLLAVLVLAGCSSISEGYITEKNHKASYTTTGLMCAVYGKYGCTAWVPYTTTHPESWWFSLVEQDAVDQGEPKTGWVYVGPQTFDSHEVGDYYNPEPAS